MGLQIVGGVGGQSLQVGNRECLTTGEPDLGHIAHTFLGLFGRSLWEQELQKVCQFQ